MGDHTQRKLARQRERGLVDHLSNPYRHEPSKAELRAQLAEAARNTLAHALGKPRVRPSGSPR